MGAEHYAMGVGNNGDLSEGDLNGFVGQLFQDGLATTTSIQRKMSALHGFYKYLVRTRIREDESMARISRPSKGRLLPALSESDVNRLLEAPDIESPIGLRDRTMLEVLARACVLLNSAS